MNRWVWLGVIAMTSLVVAFDPPVAKVGDFTLRIDAPQLVSQLEVPIPVRIRLSNAGSQGLRGKVRLQVIDRWRITSANPQPFELPPNSEGVLEFTVVAGKGTHNAHYPIHAFAEWNTGQGTRDKGWAHAVLVVEVKVPQTPKPPKVQVVQLTERGSVALWQQGNQQVSFQVFGQPLQKMPAGWWGTDETTGAHAVLQRVDRSGVKDAIAIHPPWRKGAGTIFLDWQVALPNSKPIWLDFAFAIRDHDPQREPPSDGVTVRVWVKRVDEKKGTKAQWKGTQKASQESSGVVSNPAQRRQIGNLLPLQKLQQLSVSRPISRPNFPGSKQVKGVVVTHSPTQRCLKNFFSAPVYPTTMDSHCLDEALKGGEKGERSCQHWATLCHRFHQSTQNFIFKTVGDKGINLVHGDILQEPMSAVPYIFRFVNEDGCQKHRSVYDDFRRLGLEFHPRANSLRLSKSSSMPLPLMPKLASHHDQNSLQSPLPSFSSVSLLSSSTSNSLGLGFGRVLGFAILPHLALRLWHLLLCTVPQGLMRLEFSHHPLANSLCFKKLAKMPLPLMPNLDPYHSANSISVISPFLRASTIRSSSARNSSLVSTFASDFLFGTVGHLTPQFGRLTSATNFIRPSVWYVSLNQTCLNVSKQLESAKSLAKRFTAQRDGQNSDGSIYHSSLPLLQFRPPSLNCESASNAASMNSRLTTPCRLILFNHQFQAASGPLVAFNSFNLRVTNSRSLRYLAAKTSNSERLGELFAFAIKDHLAPPLCYPTAFGGTKGSNDKSDDDDNDEWQLLYERHSDSKVWVPARVDLSAFASQKIVLRLEVHPGPKNDTTCDLAFIGEPYLVAGRMPTPEKPEAEGNQRLRLAAWARWQMAEAALQWKLLPTDKETQKQLATLRRLLPTATADEAFHQANAIAQKLLKRISLERLRAITQSLFVRSPSPSAPSVWVIAHEGELYAFAMQPRKESGWWEALGAIVFAEAEIFFDGFIVRVLGDDLSDWRSPSVLLKRSERTAGNRLIATHQLDRNGMLYTLTMLAWSEGGALKVRWQLSTTAPQDKHQPLRITDCALRSWSETAERIYIGHGNVIVRPQAFRLHADGHSLSTRHAGMDFGNGVSVVVGVDNPPDFFECQPASRHYSIHAHMDTTFTIAASTKSIWHAAKRYRTVDPYKPAPTLSKLAGRFVFDLWGGWRYAWVAEQLEKAFRYGCTDSLVIYHNWQRWGYDYRLPDIFPPNPQFGSLDDFRRMVEVCDRYGVLFAPHDNYIDFYPDADGYSYRHICFTADGNPVRAWFNEGRQAQSYRWRPDAFFPFMERNLKLIAQHIKPTAYFVDVFSSIGMFDWWTEDGEFHSTLETQRRWGEAFSFIRKILGNAPQTSESGCDWLIGWLDGATTNHLRVDPNAPAGQWSVWRIRCEDAERIPWFDFAYHHKFALHGAGYSNRYQGGLPYEVAGIYSDDYICTEVLTGHPAMVSEPFGPQVVRKYWLLAELGRALAMVPMASGEFDGGNIHRQIVRYENGTTVWVNRGNSDWKVKGHVLPPFGFYAFVPHRTSNPQNRPSSPILRPQLQVALERLPATDGTMVIAEWALSERFAYCNARTKMLFGWTPIQLVSAQVRWLGNRRFELVLKWRAEKPTDEPHHVFVHFVNPKSRRGEQIAFQGDHAPDVPTTQWKGEIVTRTVVTVPSDWGADRYGVRVGLWNPKTGYRLRLMGDSDDTLRLVVGDLILEDEGDRIARAKLELNPNLTEMPEWLKRWNTQGKLVDFDFAVTDGAFRFDRKTLTLIPLPEHEPFIVTLRLQKLLGVASRITTIEAIDERGKVISNVPFVQRNGEVTFQTQASVFSYRLRFGRARN